jgi:hypothetical protein
MNRTLKVLAGLVIGLALPALALAQGEVLYVVNDKVGIGTSTPAFRLTVPAPSGEYGASFVTNQNGARPVFALSAEPTTAANFDNPYFAVRHKNSAGSVLEGARLFFGIQDVAAGSEDVDFRLDLRGAGAIGEVMRVKGLSGYVGFKVASPLYPIHMASGAYVTTGGVWTNASSRALKQDVADLSADTAIEALDQLTPVTYAYRADPAERHVGFIAEDVPALVATADRQGLSPMDIVAVLTKVLQEQQKTIAELQARVAQLETK